MRVDGSVLTAVEACPVVVSLRLRSLLLSPDGGLALLSPFTVLTAIARREPSSRPRTREVSPGVPTQWQRSKLCPSRTLAFPHRSLWWAGYKKRLSALRRRTSSPVFGGAPFRDADAVTVPRVRRYHQMEAAIGWLQKNSGRSQEGRES